jgi:undecaprenyl-diphosphatase
MTLWEAAILGVVQGVTEFLPVSSSGHLVVFQNFLTTLHDAVAFDLMLHIGTLLPVLWVYRRDLWSIIADLWLSVTNKGEVPLFERTGVRLFALLIVGSIPTALIGLGFKDYFEALFHNMRMVGFAFAVTAVVLFCIRFAPESKRGLQEFSWKHAILIGLVQGLAITPGISRSGSTIAMALFLGLNRDLAARYSFMLSIPAITGAFLLKLGDSGDVVHWTPMAVGFVVSAISGYLALLLLLRLVKSGDFSKFSWYLAPLALFAIWMG